MITLFSLACYQVYGDEWSLHPTFPIMVAFFAVQSIVLFRLEHWAPKEWQVQMSLVKIVVRLLTSLVFITVLLFTQENRYPLAIQFFALYLAFMTFEITMALANLRRN